MTKTKTPQEKWDKLGEEFLLALDAFYDSWHKKAKAFLDKNDDPVELIQGLMKDYALGNLETISGFRLPLKCLVCGETPDKFSWADHEEEHWTDDGGQEFVKQNSWCSCEKDRPWLVTYLLLPIKLEETEK